MVVSVASVARPCMGAFSLFLDVFRVLQSDKPLVNLAVLCEGKMKTTNHKFTRMDAIHFAISRMK